MNNRIIPLFSVLMAIMSSFTSLHASEPTSVAPLLRTTWAQRGEFAAFTPQNQRLGCWSTAIGQILRYHKLQPEGKVQYSTRAGTELSLDMDRYKFNWNRFPSSFHSRTPVIGKREVAGYLYCVSVTLQKDFGTGSYVLGHTERAAAIAKHFNCKTKLHTSSQTGLKELASIVKHELDNERPIMMHVRSLDSKGDAGYHAVVVDGYRFVRGVLAVQVNMGWGGRGNGWYPFDGPIGDYNDGAYRRIMTIAPSDSARSRPVNTSSTEG